MYKISTISQISGLSADTLRYYEKLGLLEQIARSPSGNRVYSEQDLSKIKFILRAKKMNFSLEEIRQLLIMRQNPQAAKDAIRQLSAEKLTTIEKRIEELNHLRNELKLLLNLCQNSSEGCPIIEKIDGS